MIDQMADIREARSVKRDAAQNNVVEESGARAATAKGLTSAGQAGHARGVE